MARTAAETASILSDLYDETFGRDSFEPFRITWPQLRTMAAVPRLNDTFLKEVSEALAEVDRTLIPFNEFLLVAMEQDLAHYRLIPDRLMEQYLPDVPEKTVEAPAASDDTFDEE